MSERAWCTLHLEARSGVPVVGGLVHDSADLLGLGLADRVRLRALVAEVLEAIVADSFANAEDIDIDVAVTRPPGVLAVVIDDRGAPSKLSQGSFPPRIADLIRLGFADEVSVRGAGIVGNHTEIRKVLPFRSLADDEQFLAEGAQPVDEPLLDENGVPVLDIRAMTADDVLEVARLFYRVYGYSLIHSARIYEPERLAEQVRAGEHVATVAVTPGGRVVGHLASEVEDPNLRTGRIGLLAVDPDFRAHNLAAKLSQVHVRRLVELGMIGQYSEAVTVHPRSQKVALRAGAHEVGLVLAAQHSGMDFEGFDSLEQRHAVMIFYAALGEAGHRQVHVPAAYTEVLTETYRSARLPRTIAERDPRPPRELPPATRFKVVLSAASGLARISVEQFGQDFDQALLSQLNELRLNRFDLILVYLPLADPATGYFGDGLAELGLSYAGVYPEYRADGDVLVFQCLNNVEFERSAITVASPQGQRIHDFVLADRDRAQERSARVMRSRAQMARFFEALE